MPKWTEKENKILKKYYGKIESAKKISETLLPNRTKDAIRMQAKKLGLRITDIYRKYNLNINYFDQPTTQNSYWAGYIAADGCIIAQSNSLTISTKIDDINILHSFQEAIESNYKITIIPAKTRKFPNNKISKCAAQAKLVLSGCQKINQNLYKFWNITSKKSLTLKAPNIKNKEQIIAFICGYIDGDGWITTNEKRKLIIGFCGTYEMVYWINQQIKKLLPKLCWRNKVLKKNKHKNHYKVSYESNKAIAIFNYLKSVKLLYRLERKWNINI